MQIKVFEIFSSSQSEDEERVNVFLRSHKILKIDKEFYHNDGIGCWTLFISYIENKESTLTSAHHERKPKVDYKQILGEEEFKRYVRLREIRKQLAEEEAIPAYAVFTNEELSEIARLEYLSIQELIKLKGIGEKRVEKYGVKICELMKDETSGISDGADL